MANKKCRWGFLGTSVISQKNWLAVKLADNATLTAVGSRDMQRCQLFIDEYQRLEPFDSAPTAFGSYDKLIAMEDVDAIYVPLPTGLRKEWVIKAAESGKHVLCEKPCAVHAGELSEMLDACKKNGVQFMDGVMFMHSVRLNRLRELIDANEIGDLRRVYSQFSFMSDDSFRDSNIRTNGELEPHGCVGDLGWYNIRFLIWLLNHELPTQVRCQTLESFGQTNVQVPMAFLAELEYDRQFSAGFYCSFEAHNQQWMIISGTKGYIRLNDFVLPFVGDQTRIEVVKSDFEVDKCRFEMFENADLHEIQESASNQPDAQEVNLFRRFSDIVLTGNIETEWFDYAQQTQSVMDACLLSAKQNAPAMCVCKQN